MIDILLATYNSERFLAEQIESIQNQDYADWSLLIRDGGSVDGTLEIIQRYCKELPGKIRFLPSSGRSNAVENFSVLLQASSSDYVMFCDHDDVWLSDKISATLNAMNRSEEHNAGSPIVVYTDKIVTDENLTEIARSHNRYEGVRAASPALASLLVQNTLSGCTMMLNRPLVRHCLPVPPEAIMHDYWVALVAASVGVVVYLDRPTMLYRQHAHNVLGATRYSLFRAIRNLLSGSLRRDIQNKLDARMVQAQALLNRNELLMSQSARETIRGFVALKDMSWYKRRRLIVRNGYWKQGLLRNIGYLLFV